MGEDKGRKEGKVLQPPDGGWGWMVAFGSALTYMFVIPILQNFNLIFKDHFGELGFTATNITTLASLNSAFGMILGFLYGPLLKVYGYRKVAFVGMTLYVIGMLCTGIAKSYIEFIIFYGLLTSFGLGMAMASFSLANNAYFVKNRSKAVGYTMTLTGLGPIIMPFVISWLLASFGLKWTVFLVSGLSLHGFVGVLILQPVKWHMKAVPVGQEDEQEKPVLSDAHSTLEIPMWDSKMSLPEDSGGYFSKWTRVSSTDNLEAGDKEVGGSQRRKLSVTFLDNEDYKNMMNSTLHMIDKMESVGKAAKCASAETLSLEHSTDHEKSLVEPLKQRSGKNDVESNKESRTPLENVKRGLVFRAICFLRDIYDLDLFHDILFINIILGLSMAFTGEVMFGTMTPIILKEVGFNTEQTATFMSVVAGFDLLCRFLAPFVGKKCNLNSKKMYLLALIMLLLSRASLYLASSYETFIAVAVGLGVGKGFRTVFWALVLPDYVPLNKLPSAAAIQSLINGILILVSGPVIGAITSLTKNYFSIIVASNILTLATVILWCGEIIYLKFKKK